MKKLIFHLVLLLLALSFTACEKEDDNTVAVTGVSLNVADTIVTTGAMLTFTATVSPAAATNKTVSWTSSNTSVATVNDGMVMTVALGATTITVTTDDGGHTGTCALQVLSDKVIVGEVEWAAYNVDNYQIFAVRPDMYTKFYQWNRTAAWTAEDAETDFPTATPTDPWTINPCPDGWRLPTLDEWWALKALGSSWANANTRGNQVAGRFYGPNHRSCSLPSNMRCIFLPALGHNGGDGSQHEGLYWSSTPFHGESSYGYCMYFDISYGNPGYNGYYKGKMLAASVRCVRDVN